MLPDLEVGVTEDTLGEDHSPPVTSERTTGGLHSGGVHEEDVLRDGVGEGLGREVCEGLIGTG